MSLLVVGALHWDVVVDAGRLPRLGETLIGRGVDYRLGGKGGNQAIAAARAGADVAFAGRIGADAPGETMARMLAEAGVDTTQLQEGSGASGMSAALTVEDGDYGAVVVSGENHAFDLDALTIPEGCRIVLSQNEMAPGVLQRLRQMARDAGSAFWVNLAPVTSNEDLPNLADVLIVNRVEAGDILGMSTGNLDPFDIAEALHTIAPQTDCIVTLGGDGVAMKPKDGTAFHAPAPKVSAISTHGAGDVFCGTLAAARLKGEDWNAAITTAQAAAAAHVSQIR